MPCEAPKETIVFPAEQVRFVGLAIELSGGQSCLFWISGRFPQPLPARLEINLSYLPASSSTS